MAGFVFLHSEIDLGDSVEKAVVRVDRAMAALNRLQKKGMTLDRVAEAVIAADLLLSGLSVIFDRLYEANRAAGTIGRTPEHPISRPEGT